MKQRVLCICCCSLVAVPSQLVPTSAHYKHERKSSEWRWFCVVHGKVGFRDDATEEMKILWNWTELVGGWWVLIAAKMIWTPLWLRDIYNPTRMKRTRNESVKLNFIREEVEGARALLQLFNFLATWKLLALSSRVYSTLCAAWGVKWPNESPFVILLPLEMGQCWEGWTWLGIHIGTLGITSGSVTGSWWRLIPSAYRDNDIPCLCRFDQCGWYVWDDSVLMIGGGGLADLYLWTILYEQICVCICIFQAAKPMTEVPAQPALINV